MRLTALAEASLAFDSPTEEEIIPQFLSECSIEGHYYALPFMRSTEACYVNKTYVEKLGYTLPEYIDLGLHLGSIRGGHEEKRATEPMR